VTTEPVTLQGCPRQGHTDGADNAAEPPLRGGRMRVYPDRLRHNAEILKRVYGPRMIAVIKGNGYGLGVATCGNALARAGIRMMAVGSIAQAAQLRAAEVTARLLVLNPDGHGPAGSDYDAEWLVGQVEITRLLDCRRMGSRIRIHVEVDFGTGRGGVPADQIDETLSALLRHPMVRVAGLAGHLPADPSETAVRDAFTTLGRLRRRCPGAIAHIGGSDVLRWHRPTLAVWVRVGRPLYGIPPRSLPTGDAGHVTPAWAWQASATAYPPPAIVGYHGAQPPPGTPVRLDVGYADGLPPQAAQRWPILVDGHPYVIHEVFMLSSIAYPTGTELPPGASGTALLSGRCDQYCIPARQISAPLGVATTAVLMCPRSPREVATT